MSGPQSESLTWGKVLWDLFAQTSRLLWSLFKLALRLADLALLPVFFKRRVSRFRRKRELRRQREWRARYSGAVIFPEEE